MCDGDAVSWDCVAYGPDGAKVGALCFVAGHGERRCESRSECAETVGREQQRVFRRINEMAAHGDEVGMILAEEFTRPDQLLNGDDGEGV